MCITGNHELIGWIFFFNCCWQFYCLFLSWSDWEVKKEIKKKIKTQRNQNKLPESIVFWMSFLTKNYWFCTKCFPYCINTSKGSNPEKEIWIGRTWSFQSCLECPKILTPCVQINTIFPLLNSEDNFLMLWIIVFE